MLQQLRATQLIGAAVNHFEDFAAPRWVPFGAQFHIDFQGDRVFNDGTIQAPSDVMTCARAQAVPSYAERLDGTLATFAANELRITDKGLLGEKSSTNICLHSQAFENPWWATEGTLQRTADIIPAPDGTGTADLIATPDTLDGLHGVKSGGFSFGGTAKYSFTLYVKKQSSAVTHCRVNIPRETSHQISVNLETGEISNVVGAENPRADLLPDGWIKLTYTLTTGAPGSSNIYVYPADTAGGSTFQGQPGDGMYIWGAHLEDAAAFPTSYIPTTTAAVTRNRDQIALSDVTWFNNAAAGTFVSEYMPLIDGVSQPWQVMLAASPHAVPNRCEVYLADTTAAPWPGVRTGDGASEGQAKSIQQVALLINKMAWSYNNADTRLAVNGGAVGGNGAGWVPSGVLAFDIGSQAGNGPGSFWLAKHTFYPVTKSDGVLQGLTRL